MDRDNRIRRLLHLERGRGLEVSVARYIEKDTIDCRSMIFYWFFIQGTLPFIQSFQYLRSQGSKNTEVPGP